jgi:hypothetical protein
LELELGGHEKELADNQKALATAQALREKEAAEFADNEQSHITAVESLDGALHAVKSSPEMVLGGSMSQMAAMFKKTGADDVDPLAFLQYRPKMLLQLTDAFAQQQSPDEVYGVMKGLRNTFGDELEDMRHREASAMEDHKSLVDAKSQEIKSLEKQVMSKKSRAAKGKVQIEEKKEQKERSEKLLQANQDLRVAMKDFCDANDEGFQTRYKAREAENLALADAMVEFASADSSNAMAGVAGFLAVNKRAFPDSLEGVTDIPVGGPADDLCMAAMGIVDREWRQKAKAACDTAKDGKLQDAASQVEDLEDLIKEALQAKKDEGEECAHENEEVSSAAAEAHEQNSAEEGVVKSDFESTTDALADVEKQASAAIQAKDDLNSIDGIQHEEMQKIRGAAVHDDEILKRIASQAESPASAKINEAIQQLNTLAETAISYDNKRSELVQKVSRALDEVQKAAQKSAIPLRMIKAEDEEDAIKVKEDAEQITHVHKPNCDLNTIKARQSQLNEYLGKLGPAAEKLAWGSLR